MSHTMPETPSQNSAFVIGTAGHIDHGKTSLVRALTGRDLDVLPEEKERGITIALGFTHKLLKSGRRFAFVDVPGHERLIRTMVSGAAGIDAVLFCVSASEGVMPQTQEHLDILRLLGVAHGVVALTHCDLVEEELAELAEEEVRELLSGTFLCDAPIVRTSAVSGSGLDLLEEALEALPLRSRDSSQSYRLPIDRVFVKKGFGAVVTGTSLSGTVREGEELLLLPGRTRVRVRGIQVHDENRTHATSGERTALNLAGVEGQELKRGMVVAATDLEKPGSILDVQYKHLESAPPLKSNTRVRLLIGTSEVLAVADIISDESPLLPGQEGFLQLRCETPVLALQKDRFVLRLESPLITLGGGQILDPWAPRFRSKNRGLVQSQLQRILEGDQQVFVERGGPAGLPSEIAKRRTRGGGEGLVALGDCTVTQNQLNTLKDRLLSDLEEGHRNLPLAHGIPRRSLRKSVFLELSPSAFDQLLHRAANKGELIEDGPRVRLPSWSVQLTTEETQEAQRLLQRLTSARWTPPPPSEIRPKCSDPDGLIAYLAEEAKLWKIAGLLYSADAISELKQSVLEILSKEGSLSPGRFKELTGLSRKSAIPLLEFLDAQGITKRSGDTRVAATSCSP